MMNDGLYAVVVGSLNFDTIYMQDRLPCRGETFFARSVSTAPGGKGANQAVQLAKLGIKTYMVGKVGDDLFGSYMKTQLKSSGVDCTYIGTGKKNTGIAAVHALPDASAQATVAPGANMEMLVSEIDTLRHLITGAKVVVLQMEIPRSVTEHVFRIAKEAGVYVVFNAAPSLEVDDEVLLEADCLIVNEVEAQHYMHLPANSEVVAMIQAGKEFAEKSGHSLIITLGAQGSVLFHSGRIIRYQVDLGLGAVETTGCGDSYVGAFAARKALGDQDEDACAFAAAASQITATQPGAQCAMPTDEQVRKVLNNKRQSR